MPETDTWTIERSLSGNTEVVTLHADGVPLTFRQLFELLRDDCDFVAWYAEQLRESRFPSYFWEHPPLTISTFDSDAEFVLVNAPVLDKFPPNPLPFRAYFSAGEVVTFRNLGGDAILIAPSPTGVAEGYAHLGTFLHCAPENQVHALWHDVGQAVCNSLTDKPIWLSTSGLGVAWLHIRLDSSPKYYQHQPYKKPPVVIETAEHR